MANIKPSYAWAVCSHTSRHPSPASIKHREKSSKAVFSGMRAIPPSWCPEGLPRGASCISRCCRPGGTRGATIPNQPPPAQPGGTRGATTPNHPRRPAATAPPQTPLRSTTPASNAPPPWKNLLRRHSVDQNRAVSGWPSQLEKPTETKTTRASPAIGLPIYSLP